MSEFKLTLPDEEEARKEIVEAVATTDPEREKITAAAEGQAGAILSVNLDSFEDRKKYSMAVETFGQEAMQAAAGKNAILQKQVGTLSLAGGETGTVAKGLEDLAVKMKDLDPSGLDFTKKGFLGGLFNPIRRYFEKFKSADQEIGEIVESLDKGKKTLVNDNTSLELEQASLRQAMKKLAQNIELGEALDRKLSEAAEQAKIMGEDEKAKYIEEEILYPLRQRISDFQQLLAVNQQGFIAMEIIRRNNRELIRSVDRAKAVTVNALRTAVTVAGALYNQRIVLEKVTMLNDATNGMISATASMLRDQGTAIHTQASEASISSDTLKQAFSDTLQALDDISKYKQEALPRMKESIAEFRELAEHGEKQIQKIESGNAEGI